MRVPKLCIDARMINESGIGTYIRSVLPYIVGKFDIVLLGNRPKIELYLKKYGINQNVKIIDFRSKIYSISEQILYPLVVPDCDIFWSPHYNVPLFPAKAGKRVVTIHDINHIARKESYNYFANKYAQIFMKNAIDKSDSVITVSNFSKGEISRYFGNTDKINVIPNGISLEYFTPVTDHAMISGIKEKYAIPKNYLLYVGNIKPHKNILGLLESYSVFKRKFAEDISLLLVGRKEGFIQGQKDINDILDDLGLTEEKEVFFRSDVDHQELSVIYSLARAYLFLSHYEGFGLPVLEAQACNCPVIASDRASLPEVCAGSAVMVDPDDYIEIAYAINDVLTNGALKKDLIEAGQRNIKRFSWKNSGDAHASVFSKLI